MGGGRSVAVAGAWTRAARSIPSMVQVTASDWPGGTVHAVVAAPDAGAGDEPGATDVGADGELHAPIIPMTRIEPASRRFVALPRPTTSGISRCGDGAPRARPAVYEPG